MRQGESVSEGKWIGNPSGGVKAPQPIVLPDPARRFIRTAARLTELAPRHPMEPWLLFMANLSQAQHAAATMTGPLSEPGQHIVNHAVEARMPPISADGHRRDPAWRDGLTLLLDAFETETLPHEASSIMTHLRRLEADTLDALADGFLSGIVKGGDAGAAFYVAAALQVYFTKLAAALDASTLRLLEQRNLCPCCGSTSISGLVTASGDTPGTRYLYCSLCSTAWNHTRAICITCGGSRGLALRSIEGTSQAVRAETCDECHTYAKVLYQTQDTRVDPFADDFASLALDVLVGDAGFARHAPNPLLLIG